MLSVFGNPIMNKKISALDRARLALINWQTAVGKAANALSYVQNLKKEQGDRSVSTVCLLYNATGNTLTFLSAKDWHGHIGQASYPIQIQNGQWGAFLHVQSSKTGSAGAAVFRGTNVNGADWDYMMAWRNPGNEAGNEATFDNSVCIEARGVNHFETGAFQRIHGYMQPSRYNYTDSWEGYLSTIAIGGGTSPIVEAKFTLEAAAQT